MKKVLIFRLSSLGDLVMSSAALSALAEDEQAVWVTGEEYKSLLEGHPKVSRVIGFSRSGGLGEWIRFCRQIFIQEAPDRILDLHQNLRSFVAKLVWFSLRVFGNSGGRVELPAWESLSKERIRFIGYCIFKRCWPMSYRPTPFVDRFSLCASRGVNIARPDLKHLVIGREQVRLGLQAQFGPYVAVMPSSLWSSKEWSTEKYTQACLNIKLPLVILGTDKDEPSLRLFERLRDSHPTVISAINRYQLNDVGAVLGGALTYFGSDTGLAHLAEAVGTPAVIVLGANVRSGGFGPWQPESQLAETDIWCRPCGKDGRFCIRPIRKRLCLELLSPENVAKQVTDVAQSRLSQRNLEAKR